MTFSLLPCIVAAAISRLHALRPLLFLPHSCAPSISGTVSTLSAQLSSMAAQQALASSQVSTLASQLTSANSQVSALTTQLSSAQSTINAQISTLQAQMPVPCILSAWTSWSTLCDWPLGATGPQQFRTRTITQEVDHYAKPPSFLSVCLFVCLFICVVDQNYQSMLAAQVSKIPSDVTVNHTRSLLTYVLLVAALAGNARFLVLQLLFAREPNVLVRPLQLLQWK
jgi:hypothetical protein